MNPSDDIRSSYPAPNSAPPGSDGDATSSMPQAPRGRRVLRRARRRRGLLSSTLAYQIRLGATACGGVIAAYGAFLFIQKVAHPYVLGHEVSQQVADLRARLDREERSNASLRERVLFLNSAEGAEVTARRSGWHRKGETVYLLPVTPDAPSESAPK